MPKLKIDHGKRALFADVRYRSQNPAPIDETLFDLSLHPELHARLARELHAISEDAELKRIKCKKIRLRRIAHRPNIFWRLMRAYPKHSR